MVYCNHSTNETLGSLGKAIYFDRWPVRLMLSCNATFRLITIQRYRWGPRQGS